MTNISKSGINKSSRGSEAWPDSLTASDPSGMRQQDSRIQNRTSGKSHFAEHLEAPAAKPGASTRPTPQPARPQPSRSAPGRSWSVPPDSSTPQQPNRALPRTPRTEPVSSPLEKSGPAARSFAASPRSESKVETPVRQSAVRSPDQAPAFKAAQTAPELKNAPMSVPERMNDRPASLVNPASPSMIADASPSSLQGVEATESLEDWQLRLQQMLAAGSPELFMQQSPALALLSGHLEYVEPAEIPAVVAQSPLLQSILSTGQTAELLQTSRPLDQNLQLLGLLPQDQQATPAGTFATAQLQTTDSPVVTLDDTLKALGFDTRRLAQEGDLLKDNIGLDGLASYMERAERLRSNFGVPVEWPTLPTASAGMGTAKNMKSVNAPVQNLDPELLAQLARLAPEPTQADLDKVQLWTQLPEQKELVPLTVLDDGSQAPLFLNPLENPNAAWDPFAAISSDVPSEATLPPPSLDEVPLIMNVMPRAPVTTQDPFQALAQRWNANTVQTLRPEDMISHDRRDAFAEPAAAAFQTPRSLDDLLNFQLLQAPDFNNAMDPGTLPTLDQGQVDSASLQLSLQDLGSGGDTAGGDLSGQNPNESFMSQDNASTFSPTQTSGNVTKGFSVETAAAPEAPSAPVSPQQMQDILDKSSMLIKDGGGSIRLDLGSKEMGPLDLALDIHDKTVELRILTHSDQARDALVQELPRLRESLLNQNLNLEKVEIGLNYSSAWSQSSGQGQQNREQFYENTSESSSRGPGGIRSTSRSYRQSFASVPEARIPLHNGLIQVRV